MVLTVPRLQGEQVFHCGHGRPGSARAARLDQRRQSRGQAVSMPSKMLTGPSSRPSVVGLT